MNGLAELRRIAETNPDLATQIVENADRRDKRRYASERLGIIASVTIPISLMLSVVAIIWIAGFWTIVFAAVPLILAMALFMRVILTGEWSDTSWFGKLIDSLARALGSVDSVKDDD